jgi:dihydrofolate reductase
MGQLIMTAATSLDGYVAFDDDRVGPLFDFYGNGTQAWTFGDAERVFHSTPQTAEFLQALDARIGACVIGRRTFDITDGWDGRPPTGDHVFVVTHAVPTGWRDLGTAPFTFVTDGVASAVAQAQAHCGDRDVSITAGDVGGQALRAGLVDVVLLNLVPVVLGGGRPFFGDDGMAGPLLLDDPEVVEGDRVTHLRYEVRR